MAAFELALEEGADGIELDVRVTLDRVLVIHHDEALRAEDGSVHALSSLTGAQVREISERAGRPVPTLTEVLAFGARSGALLNVELKDSGSLSRWLAEAAGRALHGRERILVSSFHPGILRRFRSVAPDVPTGFLFEKPPRLPLRWSRLFTKAECLHPMHTLLGEETMPPLRASGAQAINVWTVNDTERARLLSLWGVDGIISDTPRQVLAALA